VEDPQSHEAKGIYRVIDIDAIKVGLRQRLTADAPLTALIGGVFNLNIPATVDWSKPVIEYGIQSDTQDAGNGYGQFGLDVLVRLMVMGKGAAPGVGSMSPLYAALARADVALLATPFTTGGTWYLQRAGGIPESAPADDEGYPRMQVGSLYRVRAV
jgi:hypothetical protein